MEGFLDIWIIEKRQARVIVEMIEYKNTLIVILVRGWLSTEGLESCTYR